MRQILVNITDPSKEKLVTDILNEIEGVEVRRSPVKSGRAARGPAKSGTGRSSKPAKPMTPKEKKFVRRGVVGS